MTKQLRVLRERLSVLRDRFRRGDVPGISGDIVTPWWVDVITNWGRPVVAAAVLTMCAPGEHYLARVAGFPKVHPPLGFTVDLAWGMPFVLTAYAGISAVVATKRPKGAPGKQTAVVGAILSILLAMAAQPVAHLYGRTGGLMGDWDTLKTLTVITSCIPALVLGHLLHLAVTVVPTRKDIPVPEGRTESTVETDEDRTHHAGFPMSLRDEDRLNAVLGRPSVLPVPGDEDRKDVLKDMDKAFEDVLPEGTRFGWDISSVPPLPVPMSSKDRDRAQDMIASAFDVPKDMIRISTEDKDVPEDAVPVRPDWLYGENGVLNAPEAVLVAQRDTNPDAFHYVPENEPVSFEKKDRAPVSSRPSEDELSSRRKLPDLIKDIRGRVGDDPDAIKDAVLMTPGFEDMRSTSQKRNTLNTAVRRALRKTA